MSADEGLDGSVGDRPRPAGCPPSRRSPVPRRGRCLIVLAAEMSSESLDNANLRPMVETLSSN